jgi:hypothetical protein
MNGPMASPVLSSESVGIAAFEKRDAHRAVRQRISETRAVADRETPGVMIAFRSHTGGVIVVTIRATSPVDTMRRPKQALRTGSQIMTLEQLLKGRSILRCKCGKELFVEEMKSDDGQALARFIPCKCGSQDPIQIEAGSVAAGGTPSLMFVWGPPKDQSHT